MASSALRSYSRVVDDRVPTIEPENRETVAAALGAGGLLAFVLGLLLRSGLLRLIGLAAAATGGGIYARARLAERSAKIDEAESVIRSELDDLDPVARAQVLADIARSKL
jgi:hypothetical protein